MNKRLLRKGGKQKNTYGTDRPIFLQNERCYTKIYTPYQKSLQKKWLRAPMCDVYQRSGNRWTLSTETVDKSV